MNSTKKEKIKNWLIITRIRITNFIKEHKYVSAVIGLFLISAVVGLVVSATNDTIDSATVSNVVVRANTTTNNNYANNFSIINYNVSYNIGSACGSDIILVDKVVITAKLAKVGDNNDKIPDYVKWQSVQGEIGTASLEENGLTIKIVQENVDACGTNNIDIPLMVLNAENNSDIKLESVTVRAGTNGAKTPAVDLESQALTTTSNKTIDSFSVMAVGGVSPKDPDGNSRNVKYGILLGLPNEITNLEGYYISNASAGLDIYMYASDVNSSQELSLLTGEGMYGIYDDAVYNNHYFKDLPVLSSGKIGEEGITKSFIGTTVEEKTISVPKIEVLDNSTLEFEKHNSNNFNYSSKLKIGTKEFDCTAANNCSIDSSNVNLSQDGTYAMYYNITDSDNSWTTKIKQSIKVEDIDNSRVYALNGPKTLYLNSTEGSKIATSDFIATYGVEKLDSQNNYDIDVEYYNANGTNLVTCRYSETGVSCPSVASNTFVPGNYTQVFKIKSVSEDATGTEVNTITRNIVIGEKSYASKEIQAQKDKTVATASEYKGYIKIDDDWAECTSENNCTLSGNDTQNPGTKNINYTINYGSNVETTINSTLIVKNKYYKLPITLDYSNLSPVKYEKNGKQIYALASYFVTAKTNSLASKIALQVSTLDPAAAEKVIVETYDKQLGSNIASNDFYVNEKEGLVKVDDDNKNGLSGNYYSAAIGEKVELLSTFSYGADADSDLSGLKISLDVDDDLTLTSLNEEIDESNNFFNIDYERYGEELTEGFTRKIEFCPASGDCSDLPTGIDVKTINVEIKGDIKGGTNISLRTNYIVNKADDILNESFKSNATFTPIISDNKFGDEIKTTSKTVYATPYKLRTSVEVGEYEDEEFKTGVELDVSNNKKYTAASSINVTSPYMRQNTNAFGYSEIKEIPVRFTLPEGVNYVYNGNYQMQPDTNGGIVYKDGKTILTYTYTGVEPNSWYETIFFDFTIDISVKKLDEPIYVVSGDGTTNSIENDISSDKYKMINKYLDVTNNSPIAYGQYIYNANKTQLISSMDENEEFKFETKVYNNELSNNKTIKQNVKVYTVLPYNDEDESSYNGSYDIKFPTTASVMCTDEEPSVVKNNLDGVQWKDCNSFKNGDYYHGLTAYKTTYETIAINETKAFDILVKPIGNSFADVYKFNSYVKYDTSLENEKSLYKFEPIKVEVVSKNITGIVWEDFNENGIMEDDEKRIDSVILHLYDESNNEVKEPVSPNKNGVYSFSGLDVGKYYIVAEFNYDKYSITAPPSDYSDLSKISVFRTDSTEVIKPSENDSESSEANDNSQTNVTSEDSNNDTEEDDDSDVDEDDDTDDDGEDGEDEGDSSEGDEGASGDEGSSEEENEPEEDKTDSIVATVKTGLIEITEDTRSVKNINLGLALKRHFQPKLNKYITRAEVTNALGIITKTDFGKTKLAKLNVKSMNNSNIKIVYMLEIENIKYYPGYVRLVTETIPEGMAFNKDYSENAGWTLHDDGTITNNSLANETISEGEKKYLTIAFDLVSKEAGSFVNLASIDDAKILGGVSEDE